MKIQVESFISFYTFKPLDTEARRMLRKIQEHDVKRIDVDKRYVPGKVEELMRVGGPKLRFVKARLGGYRDIEWIDEAFVYIDPLVACARAAQKLRRAAS